MVPATFDRSRLSAREDAILELAIEGMTDIQIGLRLQITPSTVNSYWVRIRGKLGQLSRTELVALALKSKARNEMDAATAELEALRGNAETFARRAADFENAEIYRAALDAMPEAVFVSCQEAVIRYANARLEAMFGFGEGELIGLSVLSLVPRSIRDRETVRITEYLKAPYPLRIGLSNVVYGQRRDGSQFRIVLLLDACPTSTGPIVTGVVRDFVSEVDTRRQHTSGWNWGVGELGS